MCLVSKNSCFLYFSFLFLLSSCATSKASPLIEQEMRFRPTFQGPTHQWCSKTLLGVCLERSIIEYKFDDKETFERLMEIELVCKVGEKRFRICDGGLCTTERVPTLVVFGIPWKWELKIIEKILVPKDVQRLIDAGAYCAAQGSISEIEMF